MASKHVRTNGSATATPVGSKGEIAAGVLCLACVPSSLRSNHQSAAKVNPDASLSFAARDSRALAWHGCSDHGDSIGNSVRPRVAHCAETPRHILACSRSDRDRNRSRSVPGHGSAHKDRSGRLHEPLQLRHSDVDEIRRRWDTAPAFVLGTVWGAALMQTSKVWIGAVPVFKEDKSLAQFFALALQLHHDC